MFEKKEKPILFSAPMINAILSGNKTQTRRVASDYHQIKPIEPENDMNKKWGKKFYNIPQVHPRWGFCFHEETEQQISSQMGGFCPYGKKGDKLWVKENFKIRPKCYCNEPVCDCEDFVVEYQADGKSVDFTSWDSESPFPLRRTTIPSIHMNKNLARIWLEITGVKFERLQDISNSDILDEGIIATSPYESKFHDDQPSLKRQWQFLWESINGQESWDKNPWVWAIEFKRIKP